MRLLIGTLYLLLVLGAVTMIYPFALMLSTATTSNADWSEFRLIPRFWYDKADQFRKYVLDKDPFEEVAYHYGKEDWYTLRDTQGSDLESVIRTPKAALETINRDYAAFMKTLDPKFKQLSFVIFDETNYSVLSLKPAYFRWLSEKYQGNLVRVNALYADTAQCWEEFGMPRAFTGAWEPEPQLQRNRDWREFVNSQSYERQRLVPLDEIAFANLRLLYGTVESVNKTNGTSFARLLDLRWRDLDKYPWGRAILNNLLRRDVPLDQVQLRPEAKEAFEQYCSRNKIQCSAPMIFTPMVPSEGLARLTWIQFIRSEFCKYEYFNPIDPLKMWQEHLQQRYGTIEKINGVYAAKYTSIDEVRLPVPQVDYYAFSRDRSSILYKYLTGNFKKVLDFIWLHGDSLFNTLLLIVLTIGTSLTVNPMAAYVLSRFRLRYAHHILVFLLATMAFPAEVIMIPGFLMVKSFPLGPILLGGLILLMFMAVRGLLKIKLPIFWSVLIGTSLAIAVGWYLPPIIAAKLGRADLNVSLMNTFYALILPGLASGYSIFLLKGFFDSLPPELYEAAMLDGASELRMFWSVTLPLCKPILAVIALGAFTGAYGAFMFAFLTCQDPSMWTLMVFLYQFQQQFSMPLVMASLVVTAIPTLLVFVFAQNIIMRGIVIPTFK
jgi:multiple sugar transport system permease protein